MRLAFVIACHTGALALTPGTSSAQRAGLHPREGHGAAARVEPRQGRSCSTTYRATRGAIVGGLLGGAVYLFAINRDSDAVDYYFPITPIVMVGLGAALGAGAAALYDPCATASPSATFDPMRVGADAQSSPDRASRALRVGKSLTSAHDARGEQRCAGPLLDFTTCARLQRSVSRAGADANVLSAQWLALLP